MSDEKSSADPPMSPYHDPAYDIVITDEEVEASPIFYYARKPKNSQDEHRPPPDPLAIPNLRLGKQLAGLNLPEGRLSTCGEAFRPYSPVLANLTGTCYWWGWVPTCGLTAILSANAIHEWYIPTIQVPTLATILVRIFTVVNLCGVKWVVRLATPDRAGLRHTRLSFGNQTHRDGSG